MFNEGFTSLALIFVLIPITWLITKRYKPSLIATKFASSINSHSLRNDFLGLFSDNFFAWSNSIGKPIGSSDVYTPLKILNQRIVYAALSFCPIL